MPTASSSAEGTAGQTFRPAKASTPDLLVFKIVGINPRDVRSARLYSAGTSTRVDADVVREALVTGVLKIRRSRRQARADRSRAARRRGGPKLVITAKSATSGPLTAITGTTSLSFGAQSVAKAWPLAPAARFARFALPARQTPLLLTQAGGSPPWATVSLTP